MFYTRDNRWALGKGVRAMHCTACDAELILTNVVPENTAAIRGFEHHTFICSGCHLRVRRVVFTRHGREEEPKPPPNLFDHLMARVLGCPVPAKADGARCTKNCFLDFALLLGRINASRYSPPPKDRCAWLPRRSLSAGEKEASSAFRSPPACTLK